MRRSTPRSISALSVTAVMIAACLAQPPSAQAWDWLTGPSIFDEEGERDWGFELVPYLFLSGLNGDVSPPAGTGTIPVDASFGDLASNLDAAFAGFLDVRYRRWHLMSDNFWVRLKAGQSVEITDPSPPPPAISVETDVRLDSAFGTLAAGYELPLGMPFALDLYSGARWWYVKNEVSFVPSSSGAGNPSPFAGAFSDSWWDGIVGLRWRLPITEKWRVAAYGDIGAGAAKLDWSAGAHVTWNPLNSVGLTLGYRVLGVDYDRGGFVYDVRMNGLLLGLNFAY